MSEWFSELRRNRAELRGALQSSPSDGFLRLLRGDHRVQVEDGELTGNDHRWRWLVVDGDHIGRRESWGALERLARKMADTDPAAWSALKSAEMDREDRLAARKS